MRYPHRLLSLIAIVGLLMTGCGKSAAERAKEAEAARLLAEQEALAQREQKFQEFVTAGKQALDAKRYELAVQQFQEALKLQEDSATGLLLQQAKSGREEARKAAFDAAMLRGRQAEKDKNYSGAMVAFRDALESFPENAEATLALREVEFLNFREKGRIALQTQKYPEAIQDLNEALKRKPGDSETVTLLNQSKQAYEVAIKARFDEAMSRGKTAYEAKNYAAAVTAYREALDASPNHPDASSKFREAQFLNSRERGRAALKDRKSLDALKELSEALKLQPNDQETRDLMKDSQALRYNELIAEGKAALEKKQYPEAIRSFTEAQKQTADPTTANALLADAKFYEKRESSQKLLNSGQLAASIAGLEEALKLRPSDVESQTLLRKATEMKKQQDRLAYDKFLISGRSLLASNRFDDAIKEFDKARNLMPDQSEPISLIRDAEMKKREYDGKKREYDRLLTSGKSALQRNRYDDAIRDFQAADRLGINPVESRKWLSDAESKKKDADKKNADKKK